jgi:hypothetical protein
MAETHVVAALKRKYAELKGELKYAPQLDTESLVLSIRQVGCVLRMFSPAEDLTAIKPCRPYKPQRHQWSRRALDILREASRPMTARELARAALAAEGVAPEPDVLMSVECSLHAVLGRLEGRGLRRELGEPKRWRVGGV